MFRSVTEGASCCSWQQLPDVSNWGQYFAVSPVLATESYTLQIVAQFEHTEVLVGLETFFIDEQGATASYQTSNDEYLLIEASKPILLFQSGPHSPNTAAIVPSVENFLSEYSFSINCSLENDTQAVLTVYAGPETDQYVVNGRQIAASRKRHELTTNGFVQLFAFEMKLSESYVNISSVNGGEFGLRVVVEDGRGRLVFSPFGPKRVLHRLGRQEDTLLEGLDNVTTEFAPPSLPGTTPVTNRPTTPPYTGEPVVPLSTATRVDVCFYRCISLLALIVSVMF